MSKQINNNHDNKNVNKEQQTEVSEKKPKLTSMSWMISEANKVLDWIMDPKCGGVDPALFGPDLQGIAFITNVEAACVFAGNVGTGIVMKHNLEDGSWSPPSAIGVASANIFLKGNLSLAELECVRKSTLNSN